MEREDLRRAFSAWRARHERQAWTPEIGEAGTSRSWFGGRPLQSHSMEWPDCRHCSTPMQFFAQLDLSALPSSFEVGLREGLLQFFYCSRDDGHCDTWQPFSGAHALRIVEGSEALAAPPPGIEPLSRSTIAGWVPVLDAPDPEDHERLGVAYDYDFRNKTVGIRCDDPALAFEGLDMAIHAAEAIATAATGDKLGGWPHWVQGAEYPACPQCDTTMRLLLQIDSEHGLDYMFGDLGCGHITQCPRHPHVLAFGWACG